ncbi:tRNA threonylcarbamoyladenosine dehydratase [Arcobacter sp. FWKO B]|uniref:tRNA threonylcarbamoyladenosine dehydratase n=1 Tax=Arcobacter sp. FWKO B TaxID=2593672 RepID=UPI0018A654BD|nr:tRNA threonylcarbamoyladenosine dehydratase [Arcobacter sp. FWKO B]QOG13099.1 tRNA threonylcarbamoyladenosine dehydratase [Arcobacter sp. FWKO B]
MDTILTESLNHDSKHSFNRYDRCKKLFADDFEKIQNTKIIILGVGGVGSFALDALYRTGVKDITIVDYDTFDITNQNRQIGSEFVGEKKVEVFKRLYPEIKIIEVKITKDWVSGFDFSGYDLILDAFDDILPKVALIQKEYKKLICSGGSAKRINPLKIEYVSIWKTHSDPFVRKIRENLKKNGFKKEFKIIFSSEEPRCKELGSFVGVTGSFGLTMASLAIERILKS